VHLSRTRVQILLKYIRQIVYKEIALWLWRVIIPFDQEAISLTLLLQIEKDKYAFAG